MKLFDSEWKVMEVLWQENDRTAKEISLRLADSIGWNKNTTYTVIKSASIRVRSSAGSQTSSAMRRSQSSRRRRRKPIRWLKRYLAVLRNCCLHLF